MVALEAAAFADPWPAAALVGQLSAPGGLVLAIPGADPRELLAYAAYLVVADEAELLRIAVLPSARRRGLARRLLAAGLGRLASAGIVRCHLEVRADNVPALALYARFGFAPIGRRRRYYADGTDALLLARDLP